MNLIASQHYCLYTYLVIPDYRYVFDKIRSNFNEYRKSKSNTFEYYHSNGVVERHNTVRSLIESIFSL